jgi:N-acetylglucosamine-6-phosphate deacetylase
VDLAGGVLCPGFLDLQVNGGGGHLLGAGDPDAALAAMCAAHARLGTTGLLPTLITETEAVTGAVLAAGVRAARAGLPGFLGLHLEGPHIDPRRKGAHDAARIRPMTDDDVAMLGAAASALPALMVTLAPEAVTPAQISALTAAGVVVSLGHTDTDTKGARAAFAAGATCVTHLYNAMSPLGHRAPGLVGAALDSTGVHVGIIPDGVHVLAEPFRVALACKRGPGILFAVSDAMAVAGTDQTEFTLQGRCILRAEGRLTLADGTLAGADVSLPQAVRWMVTQAGVPVERALSMVTSAPAAVLGLRDRGQIVPGQMADLVHLDRDWSLLGVWRGGTPV